MAEGGLPDKFAAATHRCKQICSICLEVFSDSYTLPCNHKFCALCLIGYLEKYLTPGDKDIIPCPLCRSEIRVSNYTKIEDGDIKKLDLLSFSQTKVENESRKLTNCEPCKRGKSNVKATHFCEECNENICAECSVHHLRNKQSCDHTVMTVEDKESRANTKPQAPPYLYHLQTKCEFHNMKKFKYICIDHDILCCSKCVISDHRKCVDIQSISEFRKSSLCDKKEKKINNLLECIRKDGEKIRRHQIETLSMLAINESNFGKTITELEKEIHSEVATIFCKQKTPIVEKLAYQKGKIKQALQTVEQLKSRISQIMLYLDLMKDNSDACQNVAVFIEVMKRLQSEERTICELDSVLEDKPLQIEVEMNPIISHFIQSLQSAFHRLSSDKCTLIAHNKLERPKLSNDIPVAVKINDICILQNGNVIIASNNKTLTLTDSVLRSVVCIPLSSQPASITEYKENVIAVALPAEKKVAVISLRRKTHETSFVEMKMPISRLASDTYNRDQIVVASAPETGTMCYQIVKSSISPDDWNMVALHYYHVNKICVHGSAKMIYISQYKTNKITGIDLTGKAKFAFTHHQLHTPFGLFLGSPDKLYVCSYGTQQVNVISLTTRELKDVLCSSEGLKGPIAISFDKSMSRCLVYDDDRGKELKLFIL